jgi:two-component system response regulator AtoC
MKSATKVLVVDDDAAIGVVLEALLRQAAYDVSYVGSVDAAIQELERDGADVLLTDLRMPDADGMDLLAVVTRRWPGLPVILLTAHGTVPIAVDAMRRGAADFLLKPFDREELLFVMNKAMFAARARDRNGAGNRHAEWMTGDGSGAPLLVGESQPMRELHDLIGRAATGAATVLVRGESGTGKGLVARAIHEKSARKQSPFVTLHCAALPDALLESELFGYEKGAFTGATSRKPGRIEIAHKGTLFLDEIGDITPATQVKLLRVLQDRSFERLGSNQTTSVDVRFIAATNRDLESMIRAGTFREDLFYRLNVVPLWLPPLRARQHDFPGLVLHLWQRQGSIAGRKDLVLDASAMSRLQAQPWPGNVRQLENFVERLLILSPGPIVTARDVDRDLDRIAPRGSGWVDLPATTARTAASPSSQPLSFSSNSLEARRRDTERQALQEALESTGNNRSRAARLLGVSRRTLYTKLVEHGLL